MPACAPWPPLLSVRQKDRSSRPAPSLRATSARISLELATAPDPTGHSLPVAPFSAYIAVATFPARETLPLVPSSLPGVPRNLHPNPAVPPAGGLYHVSVQLRPDRRQGSSWSPFPVMCLLPGASLVSSFSLMCPASDKTWWS